MKEYRFGEKINKKIVLCLGYFDAVHLGHIAIFQRAKLLAKNHQSETAVFTFKSGFNSNFNKNGDIFTYDERKDKMSLYGIENCIFCDLTEEIRNLSPDKFLDKLFNMAKITGVVTGKDYTYGKNAAGNQITLEKYCKDKNVIYDIVDDIEYEGQRVSSSQIKKCLMSGEIKQANEMLGGKYFIKSQVVEGRKVGRTIGFPTINMQIDSQKCPLKQGVYYTETVIDGKKYKGITNYGNCPTFDVNKLTLETNLIDFSGDLYGKTVTLYFNDYIRDIKKFDSIDELKTQLKKDKEKTND